MKDLLNGASNLLITENSRVLKRARTYAFHIDGQEQPILTISEKLSAMGNIGRLLFQTGKIGRMKLKAIDNAGKERFTIRMRSPFDAIAMKGTKVMNSSNQFIGQLRFKFKTEGEFDIEDENKQTIIQCGYESAYANENNLKFVREGKLIGITRDARGWGNLFKTFVSAGGNKWMLHFPDLDTLTENDLILMCSAIVHMDIENDRE